MFYDYAKIFVKGGDGGNGIVAFRREKFAPMGGPSGGDGGRGSNIVFVGDEGLRTLVDFKYKQHYKGPHGENGMIKNMYGASAADTIVRVPLGVIVRNADTGELIADIVEHGQRVVVAKGGRGGRGNVKFASQTLTAPRIAEKGEPGKELWLTMELKLLADVALIGMPNVGKSTIISKISAAKPKIADYPFTTLTPNLGVVRLDDDVSFVVADVPGLIPGAHTGAGLGHRFLRHIERTKVLIHVLDMSELPDRTPMADFTAINEELALYKTALTSRPQIVVANKMDYPGADQRLEELKAAMGEQYEIFATSALNGENLQPVLWKAWEMIQNYQEEAPIEEENIRYTQVKDEAPFQITQDEDGVWVVTGYRIEKAVFMANVEEEEGMNRLQGIFNQMGLDEGLRKAGVQDGDDVKIGKVEFTFSE